MPRIPDVGSYDVIVVGAGTAGCVIAARLSENPDTRVLLLEAGGATAPAASAQPPAWPALLGTEASWGDLTTVQSGTGRSTYLPRGRGVGGSSAINAMVFARGHHTSYQSWPPGWRYEDLLPYFQRTESATTTSDPALRGTGGPLRVSPADPLNPVIAACLQAAIASGHRRAIDVSGGRELGFAAPDLNVTHGRRQSAADAYLTPASGRPNLHVVTDAVVDRLRVTDGRCDGVLYRTGDGQTLSAGAERVVLTAGAIGSPQLLMLSGIGPRAHLTEVGVTVVHDLPGVGENLHDHPLVPVNYAAAQMVPPEEFNHCEVIGLVRSSTATATPDLQFLFVDGGLGTLGGLAPGDPGYGIMVSLMAPFSRGSVRLSSPEPGAPPLVDPNYFGDDRDMTTMLEGLGLARQIGRSSALDGWRRDEVAPGARIVDDGVLADYVRATCSPYFHPVGTCAMGDDARAVVGDDLQVHGITGLMVADASVMPSIPANNPVATVYAIAERAAELTSRRQ